MALALCGRLFHNCAPLKQKLRFKRSVRGLGRANLFSLSLSPLKSVLNGLNKSCRYSGVCLFININLALNFILLIERSSHPSLVRRAVAL